MKFKLRYFFMIFNFIGINVIDIVMLFWNVFVCILNILIDFLFY